MNMEDRKTNWKNRLANILVSPGWYPKGTINLLASICQDAFNEGYKAGYGEAKDLWSDLPEKEETK